MASTLPPAVLLDVDVPGLAIARSLGRKGVEVWGLDAHPRRWSLRSRYCRGVAIPPLSQGDDHLLRVLADLGRRTGRAVLYAMNDDYVLFVSRHRDELCRWFSIAHGSSAAIEAMVDKRLTAAVCERAGIPAPRTWTPTGEGELRSLLPDIAYPCLIKPAFSRSWRAPEAERRVGAAKVVLAESPDALLMAWVRLSQIGVPMLVQEVIPGPDGNQHYCNGCYGEGGRPLAQFVRRKLRTVPVNFGLGTLLESVHAPQVLALSRRLAEALEYRGNLGVEFKLDPRDGQFKLLEANARFGLSDGFARDCGVDVAYCSYRDAIGEPIHCNGHYRVGVRWLHLGLDLGAVGALRRRGELPLREWLRSLYMVRSHAVFAADDLLPFVYYCAGILRILARRAAFGVTRRSGAPRSAAAQAEARG